MFTLLLVIVTLSFLPQLYFYIPSRNGPFQTSCFPQNPIPLLDLLVRNIPNNRFSGKTLCFITHASPLSSRRRPWMSFSSHSCPGRFLGGPPDVPLGPLSVYRSVMVCDIAYHVLSQVQIGLKLLHYLFIGLLIEFQIRNFQSLPPTTPDLSCISVVITLLPYYRASKHHCNGFASKETR